MSRAVDLERAQDAEQARWMRIEESCRRISVIARMSRDGRSQQEIADCLGVHRDTVARLVKAAQLIQRRSLEMRRSSTHP